MILTEAFCFQLLSPPVLLTRSLFTILSCEKKSVLHIGVIARLGYCMNFSKEMVFDIRLADSDDP